MKTARVLVPCFMFLGLFVVPSSQVQASQDVPETSANPFEVLTSFVDIIPDSRAWRAIDYFEEGWYENGHEDNYWQDVVFFDGLQESGSYRFAEPCIYHPDRYADDVYIRGHVWWEAGFMYDNPVRRVLVRVSTNDDFDFYFNGNLIGSEANGMVGPLRVYDVTSLWQTGSATENIVAVHVSNPVLEGSLYITIRVYYEN